MKKTLTTLWLFISFITVFAQERTVVGTVVDNDGLELIGATVVIKNTSQGTITDLDGKFTLSVPSGASTLVVSFIGYESVEVNISGKNSIRVALSPSVHELDAIVVTALGIKKEKKALGYAFADVSGDELTTNRDVNFINSISNKIPGVNISQTAGGAGTSSRIIIRGIKSISGNSQPLIVVDGVPMDNSNDGATWLGGVDYGNSLMNIAPDDIETMSVLKGPNAAALYGSRAANGVIMITTKKGTKRDQMKVTWNSNFMIDKPYIVAKYQNEYGAGFSGVIQQNPISLALYESMAPEDKQKVTVATDTTTGLPVYSAYYNYGYGSWGPKMDGSFEILDWNNKFAPYVAQPDNVKDYFNTGYTFTNSISLEKGTEDFNWRLSLTDLQNKGLKPNSTYDRTSINYNMSSKMNDYVTASFKANYIREDAFNRVGQGDSRTGARTFIWMPRSINMNTLRDYYKDENGFEQNWYPDDPWHTNPYWEAYENYNNDNKNHFTGYVKLDFTITPWLSAFVRSSMDTYLSKRYNRIANNAVRAIGQGQFTEQWVNYKSMNHEFLLSAKKDLNEDIKLSGNLGGNWYDYHVDMQSTTIFGLAVPNFFSLNNAKNPDETSVGSTVKNKQIHSLYGSIQMEYKNWWFLELTGRNDWSSTLPLDNNSYFYPSVNSSIVFTDALGLESDIFSFGKVRASYAYVGKDTDPHQLSRSFINQQYGDLPAVFMEPKLTKKDLNPEETSSWEVGTDLRFFQNRVSVDFSYYSEINHNQIVPADLSRASGLANVLTNGGKIANRGVELQFNVTPIETTDFKWNVFMNYSRNRNEVLSLADGLPFIRITQESQVDIVALPGQPYGVIIGSGLTPYYKTDIDGNIVDDPNNGRPLIDELGMYVKTDRKVIGNVMPDWSGGITNSLKYKNLSLMFSIGVQIGGDIFSKTNKYGLDNGQFTETLEGRESWYAATNAERQAGTAGYVADGVLADGSENTRGIDPQVFFHQRKWGGIAELDVYDASYVKLRDVTLNYDFPEYWFEDFFVKQASLSFVAKNLWLIYSGVPNIDPESSFTSNNNGLGQEYAAMPHARSFGFNLRVVF